MRSRKLSPESVRGTDWQLEEYRRVMGEEAAERQERQARVERGQCVCRVRTLKVWIDGRPTYRTVHEKDCVSYKPWMDEYLDKTPKNAAFIDNVRPGV